MNNVNLIGRLTDKVEMQKTGNGTSVVKFRLAVKRDGVDAGTDFISCVAWKNQADYIYKYGAKGQKWAITGKINTGQYQSRKGYTVYTTEVVANRVECCETVQRPEQMKSEIMANDDEVSEFDFAECDLPFQGEI